GSQRGHRQERQRLFFQAEDGIRDRTVTEFRRVLFRSIGWHPRIIRAPPHANVRSRMPTNPKDRSPLSDWGVNPTPLSSTPRMIKIGRASCRESGKIMERWLMGRG